MFDIYLPIVNEALIFDNTAVKAELIAQKTLGNNIEVIDEIKFDKLKNNHYERRQTNNDSNSEKDYRGNG